MTGKIFKESSNIYEDEAKILFDYYKKAAEKIVEEEIACENRIAEAENELASAEKQRHNYFLVTCFLCWTVVGLIVGLVGQNKAKKRIAGANQDIYETQEKKSRIRRDYKVSKMGVAYVPVATRVPFEGKSFVVDHTGTVSNTNFSLSVLHKPKELQESLKNLESNLDNIPVVEGNEYAEQVDTSFYSKSLQNITMHDYMGNIDREVRNISYLLTDSDTRSVSIPVILPESRQAAFLDEYATTSTGNKPVIKVFDTEGFDSKLEAFTDINELKKQLEKNTEGGNSNYFKSLIRKLGDSVQLVSKIKTSSTTGLLDYTNSILSAVLKAGYNQYSAQLEAEELSRIRETNFNYNECVEGYKPFELKESSKVRYDIYNQNWAAEDGTKTNMPFGINQIEEEVLMPLINNLMQETRVERLKIYNNINDQKLTYLNKWEQDVEATFRDNRKTGNDLITEIRKAEAEYREAHNTYLAYKKTKDAMKQTGNIGVETKAIDSSDADIKEIERKVEDCISVGDAFQVYMRQLQAGIKTASEKFGFIEYFEGSLRDGESKKLADSIIPENLKNLDSRRQKIIPMNSYFATYAELPPEPSVEPKLMEDFAMDLRQVANEHIARIDSEVAESVESSHATSVSSAFDTDDNKAGEEEHFESDDNKAGAEERFEYDNNKVREEEHFESDDNKAADAESESGGLPLEVIETMVAVAIDPSTAEENDLSKEEAMLLQAAAYGNKEAAKSLGLTGKDYERFMELYLENVGEDEDVEEDGE